MVYEDGDAEDLDLRELKLLLPHVSPAADTAATSKPKPKPAKAVGKKPPAAAANGAGTKAPAAAAKGAVAGAKRSRPEAGAAAPGSQAKRQKQQAGKATHGKKAALGEGSAKKQRRVERPQEHPLVPFGKRIEYPQGERRSRSHSSSYSRSCAARRRQGLRGSAQVAGSGATADRGHAPPALGRGLLPPLARRPHAA